MRYSSLLVGLLFVSLISGIIIEEAEAQEEIPFDYPASISGEYLELIPNSTIYRDYLQPGARESYNIRVENDFYLQTRYRITLENVPDDWVVFLGTGTTTELLTLESEEAENVDLTIKNPSIGVEDIIVNVTEEDGPGFWPMTLRIVCQEGPIKVEVPANSYVLDMDYPAVIDVTLQNMGDEAHNVTMGMENIQVAEERLPDQWSVVFEERKLSVPSRGSIDTKAIVYIPETTSMNMQRNTRVIASVRNITRPFNSESITLKVQTIYNLKGRVSPIGYIKASPSSTLRYNITLENRASSTDWVRVEEFSRPQGWPPITYEGFDPSSMEISISSDSERTFIPVVEIPSYAVAGRHEVILRAVGETNQTELVLKVNVNRFDDYRARHVNGEDQKTYGLSLGDNIVSFKLQNLGNFYDTARLQILNSPAWSTVVFQSISVGGGGEIKQATGDLVLNVSGDTGTLYEIQGGAQAISVACGPGQEILINLKASVPMDTSLQPAGIVGIQYRYGQELIQKQFEIGLKLLLLDLEIVDLDGDSRPDLQISPVKDEYSSGDRITFRFGIKNNYPYPPEDVKWKIELLGVQLLEGEVGEIPTGETEYYNVTWEIDLTSDGYRATLRLESPDFTNPPEVRTDEELKIESSGKVGDLGLVLLWLFFALLVIIWLVVMYVMAQRSLKRKKEAEEEEYRKVYGTTPESLSKKRSLPSKKKEALSSDKKRALPSKKARGGKKKKRKKELEDSTEEPRVKKARSLDELESLDEF